MLAPVVFLLAGTAGTPATAAAPTSDVRLTVSPSVSAADTPLTIRVSGLAPGQKVTLPTTSVDAKSVEWSEAINYVANRVGLADPALQAGTDRGGMVGPDTMAPVDLITNPGMFSTTIFNLSAWPFGSYSVGRFLEPPPKLRALFPSFEGEFPFQSCAPKRGFFTHRQFGASRQRLTERQIGAKPGLWSRTVDLGAYPSLGGRRPVFPG